MKTFDYPGTPGEHYYRMPGRASKLTLAEALAFKKRNPKLRCGHPPLTEATYDVLAMQTILENIREDKWWLFLWADFLDTPRSWIWAFLHVENPTLQDILGLNDKQMQNERLVRWLTKFHHWFAIQYAKMSLKEAQRRRDRLNQIALDYKIYIEESWPGSK